MKTTEECIEAALDEVAKILDQVCFAKQTELVRAAVGHHPDVVKHPAFAAALDDNWAKLCQWRACELARAESKLREAARPYDDPALQSLALH